MPRNEKIDETIDQSEISTEQETDTIAEKRGPARRKFRVIVGGMEFEKRCTVDDMVNTLRESTGTYAVLLLDGYEFTLNV